ncbi:MAG: hypothetical protein IJ586_01320, partial [Alloprevotella sp.]|nr:hypothetical protein [Alloprevotella sp.]
RSLMEMKKTYLFFLRTSTGFARPQLAILEGAAGVARRGAPEARGAWPVNLNLKSNTLILTTNHFYSIFGCWRS